MMLDLKNSTKYVQIGCDLCAALDRLMVVSTCVISTMFEHPQVFPSTSDLRWMVAEGSRQAPDCTVLTGSNTQQYCKAITPPRFRWEERK